MSGTIDFEKNGKKYTFRYSKEVSGLWKVLYFGKFEGCAPAGLLVNRPYCLKKIEACDPKSAAHAANRESYDLLEFRGEHLREILLRNDAAEQAAAQLAATGELRETVPGCMVVEPWYESAEDLFKNAGLMSVTDRLKTTLQYACGVRELHGKHVGCRTVLAHRDLKAGNGVKERLPGGGFRIRLVDFATIWLQGDDLREDYHDGEGVLFRVPTANGTRKLPLSPENTAPESVMSRFGMSEKVDVYALGYLMASLFTRCGGEYVNLNELWCSGQGWNSCEASKLREKLQQALKVCLRKYDTEDDAPVSWVEKTLADQGIDIHWEDMAGTGAMEKIRALFFDATRIDPKKRPDLKTFIRRLEDIIAWLERPENGVVRYPVAVYLFHQERAEEYKEKYREAALQMFRRDAVQFARKGGPRCRALCVGYSGRTHSGDSMDRCVRILSAFPCETEEELTGAIEGLTTRNGQDKDCMLFGMYRAYQFLQSTELFSFMGKMYLFSPELPLKRDVAPFVFGGEALDLVDFCERTFEDEAFCSEPLEIKAFVDWRAEDWTGVMESCLFGEPAEEEPAAEEPAAKAADAEERQMPEEESRPASGFYTGEGALFIRTKKGEKLYVGQYGR